MQPKVPGQARDDVSLIHHLSSRNREAYIPIRRPGIAPAISGILEIEVQKVCCF